MPGKTSFTKKCHRILEEEGGKIADRAKAILLDEVSVKALEQPLQYVSKTWRDPLVPSFIILSCEAVGGRPDEATHQASIAISLMNLSFKLWDDLIDKAKHTGFVPTVPRRFGDEVALMIGGLASAKAFSILAEMDVPESSRRIITRLVWHYWRTIARAETKNLELTKRNNVRPEEKLRVFEMRGSNLETTMKIGAILGNGSEDEIRHLGGYGRYLSTIIELEKDLKVSMNMTLELCRKVQRNSLPYNLLWAKYQSKRMDEHLKRVAEECKPSNVKQLVKAVLETGAIENTLSIIKDLTADAKKEISTLRKTRNYSLLDFFVEARHRILTESLCAIKD